MNYIFNITLNYHDKLYDYYDWNNNDKITNIKKIPSFKITTKQLKKIIKNKILFDKNFLKKIENKTETIEKEKIKHSFLLSDGKYTIAINNNKKSSLPINRQTEISNIIKKQKLTNIKTQIIKKEKSNNYRTRFEINSKLFINKELKKIKRNNDIKKIKYICLECFGKTETNIDKAINKIKKEIIKNNDNFYKIYNIFKLINQNN